MTLDPGNHDRAVALTKEAIAAYRAGQRSQAREALVAAIRADSSYELAWLWMSELVERPAEKRACLERVLALNPGHAQARAQLARLQTAEAAHEPVAASAQSTPDPATSPPHPEVSLPPQQLTASPEAQAPGGAHELPGNLVQQRPVSSSALPSPAAEQPASEPQPSAARPAQRPLVIILGGLLLALLLSGGAYLLLRPPAMPPTEAPPADWHQLRGDEGISLWAPANYQGGSRETFLQLMHDSGLSDAEIGLLMLQLPQEAVFAMADPSGSGPDATWFTLAYVQRSPVDPAALDEDLTGMDQEMRDLFGELSSLMPHVVSQEMRLLGPQGNIKAQRIVTEGLGLGGTETSLMYIFDYNGEPWGIVFTTLFPSPGLLDQYDQMVRTMSIQP